MCCGSVTADHTFSTGAAIRMVRRTVNSAASTTAGWLLEVLLIGVPLVRGG
jgi:hypothetical protein